MAVNLTGPRWMKRNDLEAVLKIERSSFTDPKGEDFFANILSRKKVYAIVLGGEHPYGYLIYKVRKSRIEILDFAVDPTFRRQGYGTKLLDAVEHHVFGTCPFRKVVVEVPDSNLGTHLLLKKNGFKAVQVINSREGDDYLFEKGEDK